MNRKQSQALGLAAALAMLAGGALGAMPKLKRGDPAPPGRKKLYVQALPHQGAKERARRLKQMGKA